MNKAELVAAMAEKANLSKQDANAALSAFLMTVTTELKNGGNVTLAGFGNFKTVSRPERAGLDPATKKVIVIPAAVAPKFKPDKLLKDFLNA